MGKAYIQPDDLMESLGKCNVGDVYLDTRVMRQIVREEVVAFLSGAMPAKAGAKKERGSSGPRRVSKAG